MKLFNILNALFVATLQECIFRYFYFEYFKYNLISYIGNIFLFIFIHVFDYDLFFKNKYMLSSLILISVLLPTLYIYISKIYTVYTALIICIILHFFGIIFAYKTNMIPKNRISKIYNLFRVVTSIFHP